MKQKSSYYLSPSFHKTYYVASDLRSREFGSMKHSRGGAGPNIIVLLCRDHAVVIRIKNIKTIKMHTLKGLDKFGRFLPYLKRATTFITSSLPSKLQ